MSVATNDVVTLNYVQAKLPEYYPEDINCKLSGDIAKFVPMLFKFSPRIVEGGLVERSIK